MTKTAEGTVLFLRELFATRGRESYGEAVTMAEHSLLTAEAARGAGAPEALVVACLLHDIGHFLEDPDDEFGYHDHGEAAAAFLSTRFPPAVTEPLRLHIDAKRYLCAIDSTYHDELSAASQHTITRQGGVMTPADAATFAALPHADDAVRLRRWEDRSGKRHGAAVPAFGEFEDAIVRQHLP